MFVASEDYEDQGLSLDARLIKRPAATFFLKAGEDSPEAGVQRGDLLIVDRAEPVVPGSAVVAVVDGELKALRLPAAWSQDSGLEVWGALLWVVRAP